MLQMILPEGSSSLLAFFGILFAFGATVLATAKLSPYLPKDAGREFAHDGKLSAGKPRGAGIIFVLAFVASVLLFSPLSAELVIYLLLIVVCMMTGFLDDASKTPWGEYKKGFLDLCVAALADEFGREGQYKEAVNAMNEAFHVSPNGVAKTADYRVQRAVFALETSDPMLRSQAVSDLEQAVKLEPSNIRALELGGIVAYQSGQYSKAVEFWQELLLLTPQDSPAYSRLLDAISDAKNRAQMNFRF